MSEMPDDFQRVYPDHIVENDSPQSGNLNSDQRVVGKDQEVHKNKSSDVTEIDEIIPFYGLLVALLIICIIPNVFLTRYDGNDKPLSKYILENFHTLDLHWPGVLIMGFLINHHIYNLLDLWTFWKDKAARDALLLNFRIIVTVVLPLPLLAIATFGGLRLADTGKYVNLTFLSVTCIFAYLQTQVLRLSFTDAFTPRLISILACVQYVNLSVSAISGYKEGMNLGKICRVSAWLLTYSMYCWLLYRYFKRINFWKVCFTSKHGLVERCVANSLVIPLLCTTILGASNYIVRGIEDGDVYHSRAYLLYTLLLLLCCIPVLIIPERSARLNLSKLKTNIESFNSKMDSDMRRMLVSLEQLKNPSFLHSAFLDPLFRQSFSSMTRAFEGIQHTIMEINQDGECTPSEVSRNIAPGDSTASVDAELNNFGFDVRFHSRQITEDKIRLVRSRIDLEGIRSGSEMYALKELDVNSSQRSANQKHDVSVEGNSESEHCNEDTDHIITFNKKSQLVPLVSNVSEGDVCSDSILKKHDENHHGTPGELSEGARNTELVGNVNLVEFSNTQTTSKNDNDSSEV